MNTERPITYTIARKNEQVRIYTKDARVDEGNKDVTFDMVYLFGIMQFITGTMNEKGYAVLFEVE